MTERPQATTPDLMFGMHSKEMPETYLARSQEALMRAERSRGGTDPETRSEGILSARLAQPFFMASYELIRPL